MQLSDDTQASRYTHINGLAALKVFASLFQIYVLVSTIGRKYSSLPPFVG